VCPCLPTCFGSSVARAATLPRTALSAHGSSGALLDQPQQVHCWTSLNRLTRPPRVQRAGAKPFALATIPKVGCSNLRKLLQVLIKDEPRRRALPPSHAWHIPSEEIHNIHLPTVWHYDHEPRVDLSGRLPTFIVGRNPYVRLLSGFLDKMVFLSHGEDRYNRGVRTLWLQTAAS
jgi:Sulfotransferase family